MILPGFLAQEIKKFCRIKNIPIRGGKVPQKSIGEVQEYIDRRLKKERAITRRREGFPLNNLRFILSGMLKDAKNHLLLSPIEEYLWNALQKEGLDKLARRQHEVGPYKIDIAFPITKLAVECDGAAYHRENTLQLERDQERDKYLAHRGWRVLRIEGIAIRKNIGLCIDKIRSNLKLGHEQ